MSNTNRTILLGSLIGAAIGGAIAWAYSEFVADEEVKVSSTPGFKFQADAGDIIKLSIAVIPLVRMITNMFVPVDTTASLPGEDQS